jgi:hypothetical protein
MILRSRNDEAIAYAWMVIMLFLILFGILIPLYYVIINNLITGPDGDDSVGINHDINEGKQSEQSKRAIQFNVDFATNIPFFIVITILVFAVGRAIVVKKVP